MRGYPASMFHAKRGDTIELSDDVARSSLSVIPGRGALISRFCVGDRDVLYMDASTLTDRTKSVRGGVPLLFPSPGKLEGDHFARGSRQGDMKQHGFARDLPWTLSDVRTDGAAAATLILVSDDETRAMFPWDFRFSLTIALRGARVRLDARIENTSRRTMPFAFGIHPYFLVTDKARARIATRATRAYDNVKKETVPFHGFDLGNGETDLHLIDHGSTSTTLRAADGAQVDLRASEEFTRWVVWTLPGRDFVCVEPWTAPANALNTGDSLVDLAAGASRDLWVELESTGGARDAVRPSSDAR